MSKDPYKPELKTPKEPDWAEIDSVIEPYLIDIELGRLLKTLVGRVKADWKLHGKAWTYNPLLLFNADFGFLKKVLKELKKAGGNIEKAKEGIAHIRTN